MNIRLHGKAEQLRNPKTGVMKLRLVPYTRFMRKFCFLHGDCSTSLKYYPNKNEVLFIREGSAQIEYASEEYHTYPESGLRTVEVNAGDVFFVQSGCPYRITAVTECEIFEIGDNRQSLAIKLDEESEQ